MKERSGILLLLSGCFLIVCTARVQADTMYVSNPGNVNNQTILKYGSSGGGSVFAASASGLSEPFGVACDSSGNVYVGNYANNTILKYTPNGVASVFASSGLSGPQGLTFDSSGNLYVVNGGANSIEKFNSSGIGSRFAGTPADPYGIACDSAGNVYVSSTLYDTITKYNPSGVGTVFASGLMFTGLACDSSGNLYASLFDYDMVAEYDPSGDGVVFASSGLNYLRGLAFDSSGNLCVANQGNTLIGGGTIEEFAPNGAGNLFASGLNTPSFIAVVPIPKPSSWGLLAVGIAWSFRHYGRAKVTKAHKDGLERS